MHVWFTSTKQRPRFVVRPEFLFCVCVPQSLIIHSQLPKWSRDFLDKRTRIQLKRTKLGIWMENQLIRHAGLFSICGKPYWRHSIRFMWCPHIQWHNVWCSFVPQWRSPWVDGFPQHHNLHLRLLAPWMQHHHGGGGPDALHHGGLRHLCPAAGGLCRHRPLLRLLWGPPAHHPGELRPPFLSGFPVF